jgi:hypothetical protein
MDILSNPLFRVSAKVAGKISTLLLVMYSGTHTFDSSNMASCFAEGVCKRFPSWKTATKGFEMELLLYVRFSALYVGISLTHSSLSLSQVTPDRAFSTTPLRPAICFALAQIAKLQPGTSLSRHASLSI